MKKRVGILFPSSKSGGVYQFALSVADSLLLHSDKFEYRLIHYDDEYEKLRSFLTASVKPEQFLAIPCGELTKLRKVIHFFNLALGWDRFLGRNFYSILKNAGIDLLVVPTPFTYQIPHEIPYIVSIPDLMQKYYPFSSDYGLKLMLTRNIVYGYFAKHSLLNIADSEQGADDLRKFLGVNNEKIKVIYYVPAAYIFEHQNMDLKTATELLAQYNLPEKFIFYPANFWYQKNHAGLMKAVHLIREKRGIEIPVVLVGHAKGCPEYEKVYRETMDLVRELNMQNQVTHLGYVSEKEMVALYKKSVALVAPPFQGPTTLPPIEAIVLGTPVATANIFEVPKQVGEAGLLFDPSDIEDMADKVYHIWTDERLRENIIRQAKEKAKDFSLEGLAKHWEEAIEEAFKLISLHDRK